MKTCVRYGQIEKTKESHQIFKHFKPFNLIVLRYCFLLSVREMFVTFLEKCWYLPRSLFEMTNILLDLPDVTDSETLILISSF